MGLRLFPPLPHIYYSLCNYLAPPTARARISLRSLYLSELFNSLELRRSKARALCRAVPGTGTCLLPVCASVYLRDGNAITMAVFSPLSCTSSHRRRAALPNVLIFYPAPQVTMCRALSSSWGGGRCRVLPSETRSARVTGETRTVLYLVSLSLRKAKLLGVHVVLCVRASPTIHSQRSHP